MVPGVSESTEIRRWTKRSHLYDTNQDAHNSIHVRQSYNNSESVQTFWWADLAQRQGVTAVSRRTSVPFHFGSPLPSKVADCGQWHVTLPFTVSEKWKHGSHCSPSWCRSHAGGDIVALGRSVSLFPHPLSSGSAPTHPGDNSALNTFNQHAKQSLQQLFGASSLADFTHEIRFPNSR